MLKCKTKQIQAPNKQGFFSVKQTRKIKIFPHAFNMFPPSPTLPTTSKEIKGKSDNKKQFY